MNLTILYRGPLSSCNYGCSYCPFAKHHESAVAHDTDRGALERFVGWVASRHTDTLSIFFTPWGEALVCKRYQQALVELTRLPHVQKVAIQTNLSSRLDWIERCEKSRLGIWATFHPSEVSQEHFLNRCIELDQRGVRFSVGMVGLQEHLDAIEQLRRVLPSHIYLWVNAYKRQPNYYSADDLRRLTAIDPLFPINTQRHRSRGRACRCGHSVITVDGNGTIRRCHFIKMPIGNLYDGDIEQMLAERPCSNATCSCYIGYVHLDDLGLYDVFGAGVLERIPAEHLW